MSSAEWNRANPERVRAARLRYKRKRPSYQTAWRKASRSRVCRWCGRADQDAYFFKKDVCAACQMLFHRNGECVHCRGPLRRQRGSPRALYCQAAIRELLEAVGDDGRLDYRDIQRVRKCSRASAKRAMAPGRLGGLLKRAGVRFKYRRGDPRKQENTVYVIDRRGLTRAGGVRT